MIAITQHRSSLWLRLKLWLSIGKTPSQTKSSGSCPSKPKHGSHRATAFFDLP